jgi:PAS fold
MSQPAPSVSTPVLHPVLVGLDVDDPLFHLLFNQSPLYVGVMEWLGDDARYLAVNPATASRLGRPVEEIRGRHARDLGLPADASAAWAHLVVEAFRRGGPTRAEWQVRTGRGVESFRSTVVPLPAPAGSPPRFAYLTEDLTRLRALEQRLSGTEAPAKSLDADVEQPLAYALRVLDVAGDEVETLAALHPELELDDAADSLRDGIRNTRRAHQKLRDLLWG